MNCPLCGEVCRCHLEPPPTALRRRLDAEAVSASEPAFASPMEETAFERESANRVEVEPLDEEEASAWRGELSAKLNRYRSKRKIRPPRYPSLSLPFDTFTPSV